ncbi:HORMA-1 domain-containing protein [Streptomyces sp. NPDC054961]
MTGSYSRSASASFTITDARYVGGRVGADLRLLHNLYGKPELDSIENYAEEVAVLLNRGFLDTVDYGFRDTGTNAWRLRLRYKATVGGQLTDSRPGSFPDPVDLTGYGFYSFLTYSSAFLLLTSSEQTGVKEALPISRTTGTTPSALAGTTTTGHGYARNGAGVSRDVYLA